MLKNLKSKIYALIGYIGAVATFASAAVGTAGINSLAFMVQVASGATLDDSNFITLKFQECDTEGGTYVDAGADAYYPNAQLTLKAAQIGVITAVEYRGNAPFVKLVGTATGTVAGTMAAMALSLDPEAKPSNVL